MSLTRRTLLASTAATAVSFGGAERVFGQEETPRQLIDRYTSPFEQRRNYPVLPNESDHLVVVNHPDQSTYIATGSFTWGNTEFKEQEGLTYLVLASGSGPFGVEALHPGGYYALQVAGRRSNQRNLLGNVVDTVNKYGQDRVRVVFFDVPTNQFKVLEGNKGSLPAGTPSGWVADGLKFVAPYTEGSGIADRRVEAAAIDEASNYEVDTEGVGSFWRSDVAENLKPGRLFPGAIMPLVIGRDKTLFVSTGHFHVDELDLKYNGSPYLLLARGNKTTIMDNLPRGNSWVQEVAAPSVNKAWFAEVVRKTLYNQGFEAATIVLYDTDTKNTILLGANKENVAADAGEELLDSLPQVAAPAGEVKVSEEAKELKGVPPEAQVLITSNGAVPEPGHKTISSTKHLVDLGAGVIKVLNGGNMKVEALGLNLPWVKDRAHIVLLHTDSENRFEASDLSAGNSLEFTVKGDTVNAGWLKDQMQYQPVTSVVVYNVGAERVIGRWEVDRSSINDENPYGVWRAPRDGSAQQAPQEARPTMDGLPVELNRVVSVDGGFPKEGPKTLTEKETTLNLQPGTVRVVIGGNYIATGRDQGLDNSKWVEKQEYITLFRADQSTEVKLTDYSPGNVIIVDVPSDKANPDYLRGLIKFVTDRGGSTMVSMFQTGKENFVATFNGKTWERVK